MYHQSAPKSAQAQKKITSLYSAKLQNEMKKKTQHNKKPAFSPSGSVFFMLSKPKLFFKLCTHAENPL